jgi:hypothetical protein
MTTPASHRARGASWEGAVAGYVGGVRARVTNPDTGDITGLKGVVVECKAQGRFELQFWMRQLQAQVDEAKADLGLLAIKSKGHTQASEGLWLIDPRHVPYVIGLVERERQFPDRRFG